MTSLKVAVRVRPLSERESNLGSKVVVDVCGRDILVTDVKVPENHGCDHRVRIHRFSFDYGFWSVDPTSKKCASQRTVYEEFGRVVLNNLLDGYNSCVIAYGPSGSGKTYTMMGTKEETGLTPRICEGLFMKLTDQADHNLPFQIDISFMELYNEKVYDLLQKRDVYNSRKPKLRIREHPVHGPFVEGLSTHVVKNIDEVCDLLTRGNEARVKAATHVHERSTRSHAIFTIRCSQACLDETKPREVVSKLHLVDLAGSEKAAPEFCQSRVKEGGNINKSLVTLGNVIAVLVEMSLRSTNGETVHKQAYVPYRDSHLTWLLKDSLGGNSHTFMLAAISPSKECYIETVSTLRYAQRAKFVMNRPVVNEDPSTEMIRKLRTEVARLKNLLNTAEKLSKAYVMKPLPEITHLKSIMKESAMRVNMLTKHWFEKWLQTYDVVLNTFDDLSKGNNNTELLAKNSGITFGYLDTGSDSMQLGSSECIIIGDTVSFSKSKCFNSDQTSNQEKDMYNMTILQNLENQKFKTGLGKLNKYHKNLSKQKFESVSESILPTYVQHIHPAIRRALSLSQSHMKQSSWDSWIVSDTQRPNPKVQHDMVKDDVVCSVLNDCFTEVNDLQEPSEELTFDRHETAHVNSKFQEKEYSRKSGECEDLKNLQDSLLKEVLTKTGVSDAKEKIFHSETLSERRTKSSESVQKLVRSRSMPSMYIFHHGLNCSEAITGADEEETLIESRSGLPNATDVTLRALSQQNSKEIIKVNDSIGNGCEEEAEKLIEIKAEKKSEEEAEKLIEIKAEKNSEELKPKNSSQVMFNEQVREESNHLLELLKLIGSESTESSSGCCSPRRKDSEIMSLLSFSSLDGQYLRSLDDISSNEETTSSQGNTNISDLRLEAMSNINRIRRASCRLDPMNSSLLPGNGNSDTITESKLSTFAASLDNNNTNYSKLWKTGMFNTETNNCIGEKNNYGNIIDRNEIIRSLEMPPFNLHLPPRTAFNWTTESCDQGKTTTVDLALKAQPGNNTNFVAEYCKKFRLKDEIGFSDIRSAVYREKNGQGNTFVFDDVRLPLKEPTATAIVNNTEVPQTQSLELTKENLDLLEEKLKHEESKDYIGAARMLSSRDINSSSKCRNINDILLHCKNYCEEQGHTFFSLSSEGTDNENQSADNLDTANEISGIKEQTLDIETNKNIENVIEDDNNVEGRYGVSSKFMNTVETGDSVPITEVSYSDCHPLLSAHIQNETSWASEVPIFGDGSRKDACFRDALCNDESGDTRHITANDVTLNYYSNFSSLNTTVSEQNALIPLPEEENAEKETESDFNDTFTLDSLDNIDEEMIVWANKYLTKYDSQHSGLIQSGKINKPEIISEAVDMSEFELTAKCGESGRAEQETYTEPAEDAPIHRREHSPCSSSSTSSDSITYVFVGKEEGEESKNNIKSATPQYSSLVSSVSLDSLEKTVMQPKFLSCLSPRTLSIDSLVAEELLEQLRSSKLQPLSKTGSNEPVICMESSNINNNTDIFSNLKAKITNSSFGESKKTTFKANITETFSPDSNHSFNIINCFKEKGNVQCENCESEVKIATSESNVEETIRQLHSANDNVVRNLNVQKLNFLEFSKVRPERCTEVVSDSAEQIMGTHTNEGSEKSSENGMFNENDAEINDLDLYGKQELVIPPPPSFKTVKEVNSSSNFQITNIMEAETCTVSFNKGTQTEDLSSRSGDKQNVDSTQTVILQLTARMMELMKEIMKYMKREKAHNSKCCHNHNCNYATNRARKKLMFDDDTSSSSMNSIDLENDRNSTPGRHVKGCTTRTKSSESYEGRKYVERKRRKSLQKTACIESKEHRSSKEGIHHRRRSIGDNALYPELSEDSAHEELSAIHAFRKESTVTSVKQCPSTNGSFMERSQVIPTLSNRTETAKKLEAVADSKGSDSFTEKLISVSELNRSSPKDHLKNLVEIRRKVIEATKLLSNERDTHANSTGDGCHQTRKNNDARSCTSSEGYLSSVSSHGTDSQFSETSTEYGCLKTPSKHSLKTATSLSRAAKNTLLVLDVHAKDQVETPPSTSWQNTSADSGAFFMDSPLIERKYFTDFSQTPCGSSDGNGRKESEAFAKKPSEWPTKGNSTIPFHSICDGTVTTKTPETNRQLALTRTNPRIINKPETLNKDSITEDGQASPFRYLDEIGEEYKDIRPTSSIFIKKIPPKSCGSSSSRTTLAKTDFCQSNVARLEFAKKLSDSNYKLTREDIEKILLSIEADKKFLRRKRNPILDRCYSPEIVLCSPMHSRETLFSHDSYKRLPNNVLYLSSASSGLTAA